MVQGPHDKLFKETFSRIDVARSHLANILPEHVAACVDWNTLKLEPGSFVDEQLAEVHSDLLFSAKINNRPGYIFALFEHFSHFERFSPLRLLFYVASFWKRWLAERTTEAFAPPVITVVLHHSATGWRAEPSLASVFHPEDVAAFGSLLPSLNFVLDDVSHQTAEQVAERHSHELAILTLIALAATSQWEKFRGAVPILKKVLRSVDGTPENRSALRALCLYVFTTMPDPVRNEEVRAMLLEAAGSRFREDIMTVADQLRAEGRVEGEVEGEAKGQAKGLREAIVRVFAARGLSLSQLGQARIESCHDVALLMAWVERAVTVSSETELFA